MRVARVLALASLAALFASCQPSLDFVCTMDAECTPNGVCVNGSCAFPSSTCPSGLAYASRSPLSGCVPLDGGVTDGAAGREVVASREASVDSQTPLDRNLASDAPATDAPSDSPRPDMSARPEAVARPEAAANPDRAVSDMHITPPVDMMPPKSDMPTVCPPITIGPNPLTNGTLNMAWNDQLTASGGAAPYAFSIPSPPSWMTSSASGALSGTPNAPGTSTFVVNATDRVGCTGSQNIQLTIDCPGGQQDCNGMCVQHNFNQCASCTSGCNLETADSCNGGNCMCGVFSACSGPGMRCCNGTCVNIGTDRNNCGGCGNFCQGGSAMCSPNMGTGTPTCNNCPGHPCPPNVSNLCNGLGYCACGSGNISQCDPQLSSNCGSTGCMCGGGPACDPMLADHCDTSTTTPSCRCGVNPSCTGSQTCGPDGNCH
jgi:hypothetical protein